MQPKQGWRKKGEGGRDESEERKGAQINEL